MNEEHEKMMKRAKVWQVEREGLDLNESGSIRDFWSHESRNNFSELTRKK